MNQQYHRLVGICFLTIVLLGCATVPITGRRQLNLIPQASLLSTSFQQYDDFMQTHEASDNAEQVRMVKQVGSRIQHAVEQYLTNHGLANKLQGYDWEFNLVDNDEMNAWCMPGGKVVVYSGILPITKDEAGLAVVMGHEIAHAIADHGNERMSQMLLAQFGGMALSQALEEKPEATRDLWLSAYGIGAQVGVLLPYSRLHESEADHLGLIFMAIAGYDPHAAIDFWQRMASMKDGSSPPELLSTHPADQARIQNIRDLLPEAMGYYTKTSLE